MPKLSSITINLTKKTSQERDYLAHTLYEAHQKIFDGVSFEAFNHYVMSTRGIINKVRILKSDKEMVGYCAIHAYPMSILGRTINVVKIETGVFSEYRGKLTVSAFVAMELLKIAFRFPLQKSYYYGSMISPASYRAFTKVTHGVYPTYSAPPNPKMEKLLKAIGDQFYPEIPSRPGIRNVGWKVRLPQEQREKWKNSDNPGVQFYLKKNPDYAKGYGLPIISSLTVKNYIFTLFNIMIEKIHNYWLYSRSSVSLFCSKKNATVLGKNSPVYSQEQIKKSN
ncbi:MAG: hypothetical protein WCP39_06040 [Chlamydiota bacterium]